MALMIVRAENLSAILRSILAILLIYQNLGNTLINILRPEEAIQILEKGLRLDSLRTHYGIYL